jgi:hypothetical protein
LDWQAQERARTWFDQKAREQAGDFAPPDHPYTVSDALADYRTDYQRCGGKAVDRLDWSVAAWINPELGAVELARLNKARIIATLAALGKPRRGDRREGLRHAVEPLVALLDR